MAYYTMNQLHAELDRTPQQIRKVLNSKDKLKSLLPEHRIVKDNGRVYFDDVILEALKEYFGLSNSIPAIDEGVGVGIEETVNPENTETNPGGSVEASAAVKQELEALRRQVADLQQQLETERERREAERADLEKQLQDKEAERLHFIGENSKLLNLLTAEKQEKDKLLLLMPPAEHRTLKQRIKGLFTRKEGDKNE